MTDPFLTSSVADPDQPGEFERDHWDRPLLVPPGGGKREPYTRMSTLAKWASNQEGLGYWQEMTSALAVAAAPDISAILAQQTYETCNRKSVKGYIREARSRAGYTVAANWGTAIHLGTEDRHAYIPGHIKDPCDWYESEMSRFGFTHVDTEFKVGNRIIYAAGTCDHLYLCPEGMYVELPETPLFPAERVDLSGRVIAGDKKTGAFRPINFCAQIAGYANGERYDTFTDTWSPIHPDLEKRVGLSAHIPFRDGGACFGFLDLRMGWEVMKAAALLHAQRDGRFLTAGIPDGFAEWIESSTSPEELKARWDELPEGQRARLRDAAFNRMAELSE